MTRTPPPLLGITTLDQVHGPEWVADRYYELTGRRVTLKTVRLWMRTGRLRSWALGAGPRALLVTTEAALIEMLNPVKRRA